MLNWQQHIYLTKVSPGCYTVAATYNDVVFAEFLMGEDGYYNCWFESHKRFPSNGGYLPSYMLIALGQALEELNAPYEKEMAEFFQAEHEHNLKMEAMQELSDLSQEMGLYGDSSKSS